MGRRRGYWADDYVQRKRTAREAMGLIRPGQRVFIGASSGEPQHLVRALSADLERLTDLEIVRLLAYESTPLSLIANKSRDEALNIRFFYSGSAQPRGLARNKRFITPLHLSAVPRLFESRRLPIHVALIQVGPPDDFGWLSLGVAVDITLAAAQSADIVIAQVNSKVPRTLGRSFVHVNDVDVIVEHDESLLTIGAAADSPQANIIAKHIARLVDDGSTIQIGLGTTPQAVMLALAEKNDLGIHTQYLTDEIMHLVARGVVTNRKKGVNEGKVIASAAIGSESLYEFMHDNPGIELHPSDYVNNPGVIARHHKMVSMNVAMTIDLSGQASADALPSNLFSGVTGMLDFVRGAAQAENGKSILMLPSTNRNGRNSRIVPLLADTAVVIPRSDVSHVVTEYGAVNLFGKSLQERAVALISIAHPDFRDHLFHEAKSLGLLSHDRSLTESIQGVYPVQLEETVTIDGQEVVIRPATPVDTRRIQEHFYSLDEKDVVARFFYDKKRFDTEEIEGVSQIDYVHDLTLLALLGEPGFRQVIGIGEYLFDPAKNLAEVAFSVSREFQGKGIAKILMRKLGQAARENGIAGFMAYTSPKNNAMIKLFNSLPYTIKTFFDGDMLMLNCRFDEPRAKG
ncbi:MAG: GNAT family N-acetyltransferase [Desulfobacterales bacterium]